jgi:hypothetical protein
MKNAHVLKICFTIHGKMSVAESVHFLPYQRLGEKKAFRQRGQTNGRKMRLTPHQQ